MESKFSKNCATWSDHYWFSWTCRRWPKKDRKIGFTQGTNHCLCSDGENTSRACMIITVSREGIVLLSRGMWVAKMKHLWILEMVENFALTCTHHWRFDSDRWFGKPPPWTKRRSLWSAIIPWTALSKLHCFLCWLAVDEWVLLSIKEICICINTASRCHKGFHQRLRQTTVCKLDNHYLDKGALVSVSSSYQDRSICLVLLFSTCQKEQSLSLFISHLHQDQNSCLNSTPQTCSLRLLVGAAESSGKIGKSVLGWVVRSLRRRAHTPWKFNESSSVLEQQTLAMWQYDILLQWRSHF